MKTLARWIPAFVWASGIWYMSSREVVPAPPIPYIDKVFHATEFGVLALSVGWAMMPVLLRLRPAVRWLPIVLVSFAYALADEAHQAFVPGRVCDIADAAADLAGAVAAALAFSWRLPSRGSD